MIVLLPIIGDEIIITQKEKPTNEQLIKWISCGDTEIVNVLYKGKRQQLIVDEVGAINKKPINILATPIYHNAATLSGQDMSNAPCIHGVAVLLTDEHNLD